MTTRVTLQIDIDFENNDGKTLEEFHGAAYWLLYPFLDEAKTDTYNINGCQVKEFNIEVKED